MTFWNLAILGGLGLAAVPVIIHILNRRKARVVDWGAMRFLELSLATRGRRILLEEIILLTIRTLLILALVLAMARPLLSNRYFAGADAAQDVVILIDGSLSMGATPPAAGSEPYFKQATKSALDAIDRLRSGDSVAVVLAGPEPRVLTEGLTFDRDAARAAVRSAAMTEGVMDASEAIRRAARLLADSKNPNKRILLITDGRANGWRADSREPWQALAAEIASARRPPRVDVLALADADAAGPAVENLAIESVKLSRPVVGTDLPVRLTVSVRNAGQGDSPAGVRLQLRPEADAEPVDVETIGALKPGEAATVQLQHHFDRPGGHVLDLDLDVNDALPQDNRLVYGVQVMETLPVLLVDGEPSTEPDRDEVFWLRAAFQPGSAGEEAPIEFLVRPEVVETPQLAHAELGRYFAVVLANVERLDADAVAKLTDFVRDGGGLLVAPGGKIDRDFYNKSLYAAGAGLLPARLGEPADLAPVAPEPSDGGDAVRPVPVTMAPPAGGHPALIGSSEPSLWPKMIVRRHFPLLAPETAGGQGSQGSGPAVVLDLSTGQPLAYEHTVGLGRVILLGAPADSDWSTAPLHRGYAILTNELIYYLSAARRTVLNVAPRGRIVIPRPPLGTDTTAVRITSPTGETADLRQQQRGGRAVFEYDATATPGVYTVKFLGLRRPGPDEPAPPEAVYYTVQRDPAESFTQNLSADSDGPRGDLRDWLGGDLTFHESRKQMLASMALANPGREIWHWLIIAVVALLVAEIAFSRWVTGRRQGELTGRVDFGQLPHHMVR